MRTIRFSLFLVFLLLIGEGCDGVSSFERNNSKDPKSDIFSPRSASNLVAAPQEDGTVLLRWPGGSTFADGRIVEKALGDGTFEQLATIPGSDSSFRDTTRHYDRPTAYRIRAFAKKNGERVFSEAQTDTLDFGSPTSLQIDTDPEGTLHFEWGDSATLERAFRIEVSVDDAPYRTVATQSRNTTSFSYTPDLSFAETTRTYRVRGLLFGTDTTYTEAASRSLNVRERFAPSNVSATFVDETTTKVTWNARASFADHLKVVHIAQNRGYSTTVTVGPETEEHTFQGTLDFWGHRYKVAAVDSDGNQSAFNGVDKEFTIQPPTLSISSEGEPPDGVNLSWSHPSPDMVAGFKLIRSDVKTNNQVTIDFGAEARSYVDSDVDTDAGYIYKIRTKASTSSEPRAAAYSRDYQRVYTVSSTCGGDFGYTVPPRGVAIHPNGETIAATAGSAVAIVDFNTGTIKDCVSLQDDKSDGYTSVSFSPDGSLLGVGTSGGAHQAFLWNMEADSVKYRFNLGDSYATTHSTAFGPEGNLFGAAGNRGRIAVWRTSSGKKLWSEPNQIESPYVSSWTIDFDASGETVATGTVHGGLDRAVLRNATSGSIQKTLPVSEGVEVLWYAQTETSEMLVVSDGGRSTKLLDKNGDVIASVPGSIVDLSPSGNRIATSYRGSELLWSLPGTDLIGYVGNTVSVEARVLASGGERVIAQTKEGLIQWKPVPNSERWRLLSE